MTLMRTSISVTSLSIFAIAFALLSSCADADAALDMNSLLTFKSSVTDDPLSVLQNWEPHSSSNACNWTGIVCSNRHPGRVVKIRLANRSLSGQISPHLGNMSFLRVLNLSVNAFGGIIPASLGRLPRLHVLSVGQNRLSGRIPTELGNLSSLEYLSLGNNTLQGGIPSSFAKLSNLQELYLYRNYELGGSIPSAIGNLHKLKHFYSYKTGLIGNIPVSLCNCSLLIELALGFNQLTGLIPNCLGANLTALETFDFSHNELQGTLPTELGMLLNVQTLNSAFNHLSGVIPSSLANCSTVTKLGLASNHLRGPLPFWLGSFSKLEFLYLYKNDFTGEIPESLQNCTNLQHMELGENQLGGAIPSWIGHLSRLKRLVLNSNHFVSGVTHFSEPVTILKTLFNCSYLQHLILDSNMLKGSLPKDMGMHWPIIEYLSLWGNGVSGKIPESMGNLSSLLGLYLPQNFLSGSIPPAMGNMKSIQKLFLSNNRLSGNIPPGFTLLNKSLNYLYLDGNHLSGRIPPYIANLTNLQELDLSSNAFSGKITSELGNCVNLQSLGLSSNNFSGTIPPKVVDLRNMIGFDLSNNFLSGEVPAEIGGLIMAELIDLSHNQLTGNIALRIHQWLNADYINLSFNKFSGNLSEVIGEKLTQLQTMDLSHNNFTGAVPDSLSNLSQLLFLNFSYNNFQGRVPCSGAFKNTSKFSFLNNPQLCGSCFSLPECKGHKHKKLSSAQIITRICIPVGSPLLLCSIVLFIIALKRRTMAIASVQLMRQFKWVMAEEIQRATRNFSNENLIGEGAHGRVYRGLTAEGDEVAVKVFFASTTQTSTSNSENLSSETRHFKRECETLGKVRHRNLIRIFTACWSVDFRALIMPLMPSSLSKLLHDANTHFSRTLFNVEIRVRVLLQLAHALSYLHHDCTPSIIHCDVKPENVLLDEEMTVHLSDFGIARLLNEDFSTSTSTLKGSIGYIAPEYGIAAGASTKGDVYSFGVVILEVVTGMRPTHSMFENNFTLHKWVCKEFMGSAESKERRERVKRMLREERKGVEIEKEREWIAVEGIIKVGLMCSCERAKERPSMREVEGMLYMIFKDLQEIDDEDDEQEGHVGVELGGRRIHESFDEFLKKMENDDRESSMNKDRQHDEEISNTF